MIGKEREAEILRLYHVEKWKVGTIAAALGHHHMTVERVLRSAGVPRSNSFVRRSIVDPFIGLIVETLEKYPRLRAPRLYEMVRQRGYTGGPDHFRALVARLRPRAPAEAFLRLRTLPGEQAQVDWGHFGKIQIGRATRPLMGFVMVLSWSRQIFLRFYLDAKMPSFLRGHVEAFDFFGGVPKKILYDNLKSAVLERYGDAIRFHPTLIELATRYRFEPLPVAPARGNEKGRVERAIRYVRDSFFAARPFVDVVDLNAQAHEWMTTTAAQRPCPEDKSRSVSETFADEKKLLIELPGDPFPTDERDQVEVGKTPYVRFDLNDYSVPHTHTRRTLIVIASPTTVRIYEPGILAEPIATHARCYSRGEQTEQAEHIAGLVEQKARARQGRLIDRLHATVPHTRALLSLLAERGGRGGQLTSVVVHLQKLLETHQPADVDRAVALAIEEGRLHIGAIRHLLDKQRDARAEPPPVTLPAPKNAAIAALLVRPHALETYDALTPKEPTDEEENP